LDSSVIIFYLIDFFKETSMEGNRIEIARDLCNGCGLCVTICPTGTISLIEEKATASGGESIFCGHCEAVCPREAIRIHEIDKEMSQYKTFTTEKQWLPPGKNNISLLVQLMASRRSCRHFTDQPVESALLEDLMKIGITAPSGTNSQSWTFTILPARKAVTAFAERLASFFEKLNATAEKTLLRMFLKLLGKGELEAYYRGYYLKVLAPASNGPTCRRNMDPFSRFLNDSIISEKGTHPLVQ
jgi:ferredoxin